MRKTDKLVPDKHESKQIQNQVNILQIETETFSITLPQPKSTNYEPFESTYAVYYSLAIK